MKFVTPGATARAISSADDCCQRNCRGTRLGRSMAKPTRTIVFVAADLSEAKEAASAFEAASKRLGITWEVLARDASDPQLVTDSQGAKVVVMVDLPDYTMPDSSVRTERLSSKPELAQAVNGLIARLLGGSDA